MFRLICFSVKCTSDDDSECINYDETEWNRRIPIPGRDSD